MIVVVCVLSETESELQRKSGRLDWSKSDGMHKSSSVREMAISGAYLLKTNALIASNASMSSKMTQAGSTLLNISKQLTSALTDSKLLVDHGNIQLRTSILRAL